MSTAAAAELCELVRGSWVRESWVVGEVPVASRRRYAGGSGPLEAISPGLRCLDVLLLGLSVGCHRDVATHDEGIALKSTWDFSS